MPIISKKVTPPFAIGALIVHLVLFWISAWLARFGIMLRGTVGAEMPADLWASDYVSIAAWSGAVALMYAGFIVFWANYGVGVIAICKFIKSKGWNILWCGPVIAIYANIFLYQAVMFFLMKPV